MKKLFSFKNVSSSKAGLFILFIALIAASTYFFVQYQTEKANNPAREVRELVKVVSKIMELPDELPTLATVTEKEKLSEQNFFKQAENGDKVLIYIDARKAILYRPSSKKVVDVTKINQNAIQDNIIEQAIEPTPISEAPEPAPENNETPTNEPLTITLLNGTTTAGLTKVIEDSLVDVPEKYSVVDKQSAEKQDYETTMVVDVSEKNADQAEELARIIGGEVVQFPAGEILPSSDLMVIVGSDLTE